MLHDEPTGPTLSVRQTFQRRGWVMQAAQWTIAAVTAIFVALVAFLQWRTAQQKAVLDLFEKRYAIYEIVRSAVGKIMSSSTEFDQTKETDSELKEITDKEMRGKILQKRRSALDRIGQFHRSGKPLFARYMRFSQTVPTNRLGI
jgi:hypothetical protein